MSTAVTMFSGGRGGAGIARRLVRTPGIRLSLVINGYDNGLSTGALRRFLPGMLGPSDFRKNLLLHLEPGDPRQAMLERRLPAGTTPEDLDGFIDGLVHERVARELRAFADRLAKDPDGLDLADCSLGNLVFAGAYLRLGEDFNAAVDACAALFGSPVRLLNATGGENAFLVALKQDGRLLADEAEIVSPQDASAITDLFLLREPPDRGLLEELASRPAVWIRDVLACHAAEITPNPRALEAISDADLIVYGPGTPHSSLLPSYLTPGLAESIAASRATAKVFVVNTRDDHDIQGLSAPDLVDLTLAYLGDPGNERRTITHVLSPRPGPPSAGVPEVPRGLRAWAGARWITADLEDPDRPGVHCGRRTVEALTALCGEAALVPAE